MGRVWAWASMGCGLWGPPPATQALRVQLPVRVWVPRRTRSANGGTGAFPLKFPLWWPQTTGWGYLPISKAQGKLRQRPCRKQLQAPYGCIVECPDSCPGPQP